MISKKLLLTLSLLVVAGCQFNPADTEPPTVLDTFPAANATQVDPTITQLSVTFSETMLDHSWSWTYDDATTFPEITGDPTYTANTTVNHLPVQLKPNTTYEIHLNSVTKDNFKDLSGNALLPYNWSFTTGQ